MSFPPYIEKRLAGHWSEFAGQRHDAWRNMAYSMVGERIPDDVIFGRAARGNPERTRQKPATG